MGKENSSRQANSGSGNNSNRRRFNRKKNSSQKSNGTSQASTANKSKTREYKFYLHDSAGRKTSESYNKILEAIILRIEKTFEQPIDVSDSIRAKTKKVYDEPEMDAQYGIRPYKERAGESNDMEEVGNEVPKISR